MNSKQIFVFFIFSIFSADVLAQIPDKEIIQSLIEEIAEAGDEELDYSLLYEDLYYYAQNPLNLNNSNREELERFQFLTDFQIEDIFEYIRISGEMYSIYELQLIESFSAEDIKRILPFVKVELKQKKQIPDFKQVLKYGRNNVFLRTQFILQEQNGYTDEVNEDNQYRGNKLKYYTRYQFDYKQKIKFGFVAEKDAGEQFLKDTQKYRFDYYSAHLQVEDLWKFKTINLGDFHVRFGQGLIAWSGLSYGKSSFVMSIRKTHDGLRKYSSTDENKFMRGVGSTIKLGNFDLTGFVSFKYIDGNIEQTDSITDENQLITSFQITGLHRNTGEIFDRHSVSEFVYGGNIKWNKPWFKIGASYIEYYFGTELNENPSVYNQYEFRGNHGLNASIDYQANYKNIFFFGEEAISHTGGFASLNSLLIKLAPQISLAALHRYYSKDYQAFYAGAFAEQSKVNNESGVYFGMEIHPIRNWKVSTYIDVYSFPWLKYRTYSPSNGTEFFTQIDYNHNQYVDMYLRYKHEANVQNSSEEYTGVLPLNSVLKRQLRFHITYRISGQINLKNRLEYIQYDKGDLEPETGFVLYQDIDYNPSSLPLDLSFRIAFFDATYNARIYTYENDILYGYSIPGLSGQGIRTYITLRYTIIKDFIDIWLRYANTAYSDRDEIGSSYDIIKGNNKSEVKFQVRIKF